MQNRYKYHHIRVYVHIHIFRLWRGCGYHRECVHLKSLLCKFLALYFLFYEMKANHGSFTVFLSSSNVICIERLAQTWHLTNGSHYSGEAYGGQESKGEMSHRDNFTDCHFFLLFSKNTFQICCLALLPLSFLICEIETVITCWCLCILWCSYRW